MTPVFDGPSESKWYWGKHRRQSDVWRNCILNKSWTHFITVVYSEHLSLSLGPTVVAYYDNTPFWIPAGTNKDDLECPIHLKVRLVYGMRDVRLLRVSTICIGVARGGGRGGLEGLAPSPYGQLTRCFSAVAELLVSATTACIQPVGPCICVCRWWTVLKAKSVV